MFSTIEIIAAGKIKKGPLLSLWEEYEKRMSSKLVLHEIPESEPAQFEKKLMQKVSDQAVIIALDETGKSHSSTAFAKKLQKFTLSECKSLQFFIGAADGLPASLIQKADLLLAFGTSTWPHKLVRIMLLEQIYRAETITQGHPYHRDG